MKKFILWMLVLLPLLHANAQFGGEDPVTVEESVTVNGAEGVITFEAFIESGYHMYSTNIPDGGPTPTSVTFRVVEGAELVGSLTPGAGAVTTMDPVFEMEVSYFDESAKFTQKVKFLGGKYRIQGTMRYQSCNDGGCFPGRYEFDITGEVELPKEKAVEKPVEKAEPKKVEPAKAEEPKAAVPQPIETAASVADTTAIAPVVAEPVNPAMSGNALWTPVIDKLNVEVVEDSSIWLVFILGFGGGLIALLTPCVWPIIPMTVSFFLKRSKQRSQAIREAIIYGVSIVLIYLVLGLAVTLIFGAGALNALSTNAIFNIIFCLMLLVFGASFLGGFELTLPSSWTNKVDEKASNTTGLLSIFFMAFTLVLVSFSCTGPIIGFLLVEVAASGEILAPAVGMFGFALALALPFTVFALFPSLLKQAPRSGGWMNTVKVVLGFVEIAFALKFLSVADLSYHWGILDREAFLALWIVLFALLGLYLIKVIRFPHDNPEDKTTTVTGFFAGVLSLAFAVYMIPGLWGAPCKAVSAFAPPMSTQDFNLYTNAFEPDTKDFELAMEMSRKENKPVMLDFTGFGCVNCREMESDVLANDKVLDILQDDYIVASLYVDDKTPLAEPFEIELDGKKIVLETVGDKWMYLQNYKFGSSAQPFYVLVDSEGMPLNGSRKHNLDVDGFADFLKKGLDNFKRKAD
ncbi:MAG: thioredoxin family protein [Bacteroidaceae bacterium]|nr:thioredoxin family protein [Bacteroidaceae bacterium]